MLWEEDMASPEWRKFVIRLTQSQVDGGCADEDSDGVSNAADTDSDGNSGHAPASSPPCGSCRHK